MNHYQDRKSESKNPDYPSVKFKFAYQFCDESLRFEQPYHFNKSYNPQKPVQPRNSKQSDQSIIILIRIVIFYFY